MKRALLTGLFFFTLQLSGLSQTNNWTSGVTGNWHDLSWSLGIRPLSNQWVNVTNFGSKAVIVNSTTRDTFRASMTVSNLSLSAPLGATNTILLNFTGTAVPFQVLNRCYVGTNGVLLNLFAGLTIGKANETSLVIEGGTVSQEGGSNICNGWTQVGTDFGSGRYNLTNGVFKTGSLNMNYDGGGHFEQSGGETLAEGISIGSHEHDASFVVSNGVVKTSFISVRDGHFTQNNSAVVCGTLALSSLASFTTYTMAGGSLTNAYTRVGEGTDASMVQSGGTFVTRILEVSGDTYFASPSFTLNGGSLFAEEINRGVGGLIFQNGGALSVKGDVYGGILQSGGLLTSSNTYLSDYFPFTFIQSGGTNITTNTFVAYDSGGREKSKFILQAGRLDVGNFVLGLDFFHTGGTFTNRGQMIFRGGRLFPTVTQESFGAINVELDSALICPSNSCVMRFANSANIPWDGSFSFYSYIPRLEIEDWKGSTNGGGFHQIFVGVDGLTAAQLEQIIFVDPAGLPAGSYNGKLLPSGELVPTTTIRLALRKTTEGFTLMWLGSQQLQSATNVQGPYLPVTTSSTRYVIPLNENKRFFRLKN